MASDPDLEQHRSYPYRYPTDRTVEQIRVAHPDLEPDQITTDRVRIAGRLTLVRRQGGLTFAVLRDRTGELQLFVDTAVLGAEVHREFDACDRGDWVGVEGVVMTIRRGELSVRVESFALLAKAPGRPQLPLPADHRIQHPAPLVEALNAISARWRGKAPERGFTMSLSQDIKGAGSNPEFLLCVALDEHGRWCGCR